MNQVKLFTAEELDAITASFINTRFIGFLGAFAAAYKIEFKQALSTARIILENAEIPQQ